jgi:quinoprotein glucose dehydrogenase
VPSPTQPFPTKPAPFDYQGVTLDDLVDFTPEIRAMAVEAVEGFRLGPLFTPLDRPIEGVTRGTIMRPPPDGTAGWAGAAVDPETGMLYVPSRNRPAVVTLYPPDAALGATVAYTHGAPEAEMLAGRSGIGPQMPQGLPLLKPPYSRMTAIDMNTGEHAWSVPTGDGNRYRKHPRLRDLDLPPLGGDNGSNGPLLTKTLLLYCLTAGGTLEGPRLVAYDKTNGAELGSVDLPSGAIGTPMTYMVNGRQYIALTVGGGPRLVAFALPDGG